MLRSPVPFALTLALSLPLVGCKKEVEPEVTAAPVEEEATAAPKPEPSVPEHVKTIAANFNRVFFEFDSSDLTEESQNALNENVVLLQKHTDVKVQIQGHADERGTTDYNLALGQRRADAITQHVIGQGIAPSRITVVSYGEEVPLVAGSNEQAWSQNRRAEFIITWGADGELRSSTEQ